MAAQAETIFDKRNLEDLEKIIADALQSKQVIEERIKRREQQDLQVCE